MLVEQGHGMGRDALRTYSIRGIEASHTRVRWRKLRLVNMPYIPSIDVLGEENLLRFPTSAIFSSPPPDLIPFNEFKSKGIYVPLALTVGAHEIDGSGLVTVDLEIDHDTPSLKHSRRKKDREVVKVAREDAWKLGMDEAWVEPEGTCQGDISRCVVARRGMFPCSPIRDSEQTPWGRGMSPLHLARLLADIGSSDESPHAVSRIPLILVWKSLHIA